MQMNVDFICFVVIFSSAILVLLNAELQQVAKLETNGNLTNQTGYMGTRRRRKRFDYEDTYEWEDDDDLTYESYYVEEEEERNLFQKIALHWREVGPRVVCLGALLILFLIIICSCLRLACRFWCKSMGEQCACCCMPGLKETCQMCYTDPMYEKVKDLGDVLGIEISFQTYEKIKEHYIPDTGFDPLERPLFL